MLQPSKKMRLAWSTFFRKAGHETFVRNVSSGEEFIFSGGALPIFSALRREATLRTTVLHDNIRFLRDLASYGLLDEESLPAKIRLKIVRRSPLIETSNPYPLTPEYSKKAPGGKPRLRSAGLELTYRCNARCRHCYLDISKEQSSIMELSGDEWMSVIDQLARMGCMTVLVTGGEPTLHPAFLSILEHIVKRRILCDVFTNGIEISDDLLASLRKLPLNSISVSLYSGTDEFHDAITGIPGSFEKTLANLLRFKKAGFYAYAKTPIFHGHLEDFFAAKKLGEKYDFLVQPSNILVPGHSGKTRNPMMMDSAEYREFLERERTPDPNLENSITPEKRLNRFPCDAGQSTLCISPSGDVMPCNAFLTACGNVRQMSLSKIWRGSEFFRKLRKIRHADISPACANCKDIAYCTVCAGASWTETRGKIVPCSWSCEQTRIRAAFYRGSQKQSTKEEKK